MDPEKLWNLPDFWWNLAGWARELEAELQANPPKPENQPDHYVIRKPGDP